MRFLVLVATLLIALLAIGFNADANSIEAICLVPSDVREDFDLEGAETKIIDIMSSVQDFYCKQVRDHGFGEKTFTFNRDVVFLVSNTRLKDYIKSPRTLMAHVAQIYGLECSERILVIFVAGAKEVGGSENVGFWALNCNNAPYDHRIFVPLERKSVAIIVAHEIGHAFYLEHNSNKNMLMASKVPNVLGLWEKSKLADVSLDYQEALWLDPQFHFNNKREITSFPHIVKRRATFAVRAGNKLYVSFNFQLTSDKEVQQTYLYTESGIVLDWDNVAEIDDFASFTVPKSDLEGVSEIRLKVINCVGGITAKDFPFVMPNFQQLLPVRFAGFRRPQ